MPPRRPPPAPAAAPEVPLQLALLPAEAPDAGSARLRLSPADLGALGATLGDALLVRVWSPEAPERSWRFLCVASVTSDQPSAARAALPACLDPCVQAPPLSQPLAALRAIAAQGAPLAAAATRLPGRPAPCDALALRGGAPGLEPLLRQRVLLPGCALHLGAATLRVAAATAAVALPEGQPLRVLAGTRISLLPDAADAPNGDAVSAALSALSLADGSSASAASQPTASAASASADAVFAGALPALEALRELIAWPQLHGAAAAALGVRWPRGVLLHGPPGCGKTLLVRAVAAEAGAALHVVTSADVVAAYAGESERRLRDAFAAARAAAASGAPVVVFLDELDALCPRRSAGREHEARLTAQLLVLMDGGEQPAAGAGRVVVVGATNRPDALDDALRRPGRFDREVEVSVPDADARAAILALHAARLPRHPALDLRAVAAACFGYTGADLAALAREAATAAIEEADASGAAAMRPLTASDFAAARKRVGASLVRGVAVEAAPVAWADIGGLEDVKRRLRQAVEWPLLHGGAFARLGLRPPRGVLLHGPPGCSKTMLARAAAHASGATLIPLSGAQLFSAYLGEGERALQRAFRRARAAAPAIILLDEADAVGSRRPAGGDAAAGGGSGAEERLLCTLLSELDGIAPASGVLVVAATNRPSALDAALLRPGRLDLHLYVPLPDRAGRAATLRIHAAKLACGADVDVEALADVTNGCTGAELAAICAEAALAALREAPSAAAVAQRHFVNAAAAAPPSLTPEQLAGYAAFGLRARGNAAAAP